MLDDAEKQSIREWFRKLVRSRGPGGGAESTGVDEEARLTRDLQVPRDLGADVKGGAQGGSSGTPSGSRVEPDT